MDLKEAENGWINGTEITENYHFPSIGMPRFLQIGVSLLYKWAQAARSNSPNFWDVTWPSYHQTDEFQLGKGFQY